MKLDITIMIKHDEAESSCQDGELLIVMQLLPEVREGADEVLNALRRRSDDVRKISAQRWSL